MGRLVETQGLTGISLRRPRRVSARLSDVTSLDPEERSGRSAQEDGGWLEDYLGSETSDMHMIDEGGEW